MVSLIVAHARQFVIGYNGDMPWHLPNDLKHVKTLTTGQTIVMGRKTFDTLKKALPNRKNVVLTSNTSYEKPDATVIHNIEDIKSLEGEVFIFGGATIYEQTMHLVNTMYITYIDEHFGGDTFFPEYDLSDWDIVEKVSGQVDDKNKYPHTFYKLVRRS